MAQHFIMQLPCFACLFWGVTLLCKVRKNYLAQNILAFNLLVLAVVFYIYRSYIVTDAGFDCSFFYKQDILFTFLALSVNPLYILYFRVLTNENRLGWRNFLSFLPALVLGVATMCGYILMGEDEAVRYVREVFLQERSGREISGAFFHTQYILNVVIFNAVLILQTVYMAVYAVISLMRYRRRLKEYYSDAKERFADNNILIFGSMISCVILALLMSVSGRHMYAVQPLCIGFMFIIYTVVVYILSYSAYNLKYTVKDLAILLAQIDQEALEGGYAQPLGAATPGEEEICGDKKRLDPELIQRFNDLIEEQQIFLQSDLRLVDVVRLMRTNRTYISRLINEEYGCTFSDYINRRRIIYAQQLMMSNAEMAQKIVAQKSGFSHVSSFSRIFKHYTNQTPGGWLKNPILLQ